MQINHFLNCLKLSYNISDETPKCQTDSVILKCFYSEMKLITFKEVILHSEIGEVEGI